MFISAQPTASNRPQLAVLVGQTGTRRKGARALAEQAALSIVDEVSPWDDVALERRRFELKQELELTTLKGAEQRRIAAANTELAVLSSEADWAEQSHRAEVRRVEQELARKALLQQGELGLEARKAEVQRDGQRQALELQRLEAENEAARQRALAEVELLLNHGRALRDLVTQGLPQIANAFKQNFGTVNYTQLGSGEGGGPLAMIGSGMAQVLAVAKSFDVLKKAFGA